VAFIDDLFEVRDCLISFVQKIAAGQDRRPMHRNRLDHDHRGAAASTLPVIPEMALRRQTALAHIDRMRAEYDAVL